MRLCTTRDFLAAAGAIMLVATGVATAASTPYSGTPTAVPGTIQAENFDRGGAGVAYHDNVRGNAGGQYRTSEDVDIIGSSDSLGGGYVVNNLQTGEWLVYTINVATSGQYDVDLRASSAFTNSAFHIEIDGQNATGRITVPNTAGWNTFQWVGKKRLSLTAGTHVMKLVSEQQYFNLNSIRLVAVSAPTPTPYSGTPSAVPGTIQAENFDRGGEGLAYHDNVTGNAGGQYRTGENVDIVLSTDSSGGGHVVNNFQTGEWLAYTINVATSGQYDIELRASSAFSSSAFHVKIDNVNITGRVTVPNTGNWTAFQWLGKKRVSLTAGRHIMKVAADQEYFDLNSIRVTSAVAAPPPPPPPPTPSPNPGSVAFLCTFPNSARDCGFGEQAKVAGRATLVSTARDGLTAVRLHTEPGDSNVSGSGSAERNDLSLSQSASDCYEGREHWWAHSVLFPSDYVVPSAGGWGVVMDFHHTGSSGQANFHVDAMPNGLRLRGYGGATVDSGRYEVALGPVVRNVWYDFVYHVKWSSGSDGFLQAWVNGVQKLDHRGPTLYSGMGCYLKLANYHTAFGQPSSVIHDRVLRGSSALAVSPGPLQGVLTVVDGVLTPVQ